MALFQLSLISIIAIIVIIFIIWKITKKILLTILLVSLLFGVAFIFAGVIIYQDFKEIEQGFSDEEKLILLVDKVNGEVLSGINIKDLSFEEEAENNIESITEEELNAYTLNYNEEDYDAIKGDRFKIFLIDIALIEDSSLNEISIGEDVSLTKDEIVELLRDDEKLEESYNLIVIVQGLDSDESPIESKEDYRAFLFSFVVFEVIGNEGPGYLLQQFKNDNLIIYPETITFKIVKLIPNKIVENLVRVEN